MCEQASHLGQGTSVGELCIPLCRTNTGVNLWVGASAEVVSVWFPLEEPL